MDKHPKPYTAASLARAAGVHRSYVARLCRQGKIEADKVGGHWIIAHDVGLRWINSRREPEDL